MKPFPAPQIFMTQSFFLCKIQKWFISGANFGENRALSWLPPKTARPLTRHCQKEKQSHYEIILGNERISKTKAENDQKSGSK